MSENRTFVHRVIYGALIVALLIPLALLSQPATLEAPGGLLSRMRREHKLSQAELGDIDPTSATIKLATMGMGAIAVQALWHKADEYKKKEDYVNLGATLEQIVKLQPNFFRVWDFQAHNLSYNISAEFDDYHDKYYYIMKGIDFLKEGQEKNATEPRLLNRLGWYIAQKIGRADEHDLFRVLFRQDAKWHATDRPDRPLEARDNWLVGKEKFAESHTLADEQEGKGNFLKTSPMIFYSEAAKSQINYAENLEIDGTFGETARRAWEVAKGDMLAFSQRPMQSSIRERIRLGDYEAEQAKAATLAKKLEAIAPGVKQKIYQEKLATLTPAQRRAHETAADDRNLEQRELYAQSSYLTEVEWDEVAERVEPSRRAEAKEVANALIRAEEVVKYIDLEREKLNYDYWWARCQSEVLPDALAAREATYKAGKLYDQVEMEKSVEEYEKAWRHWRVILDQFPRLRSDSVTADEMVEEIERYKKALHFAGKKFPEPFILQDVIDLSEQKDPDLAAKKAQEKEQKKEAPAAAGGGEESKGATEGPKGDAEKSNGEKSGEKSAEKSAEKSGEKSEVKDSGPEKSKGEEAKD